MAAGDPAFADVDVVVANAAGCGSALKDYRHWLPDDAACSFTGTGRLRVLAARPAAPAPETVTYHDGRHLAHAQQVRAQPHDPLRRI
jgi:glycolate oxidase iron-sulfur subunit